MMRRLAANLTFLFAELPFLERFAAAKQAGFSGVEMLFPFAYAPEAITEQLKLHNLTLVLHNTPAPDWDAGDRGLAALPGQETAFQREFARCLRYAEQQQPEHIHIMAGLSAGPDARRTFIKNLRWASAQSPHQSFTIEPINSHDMPGYFLNDFDLALDILEEVGADNLGLQFDVYHAQRITGDSSATWAKCRLRVRHIQIAGYPGRHEPVGGDIDYPAFLAGLDEGGYRGWVSAEYFPGQHSTVAGLGWMTGA